MIWLKPAKLFDRRAVRVRMIDIALDGLYNDAVYLIEPFVRTMKISAVLRRRSGKVRFKFQYLLKLCPLKLIPTRTVHRKSLLKRILASAERQYGIGVDGLLNIAVRRQLFRGYQFDALDRACL